MEIRVKDVAEASAIISKIRDAWQTGGGDIVYPFSETGGYGLTTGSVRFYGRDGFQGNVTYTPSNKGGTLEVDRTLHSYVPAEWRPKGWVARWNIFRKILR